MALLSAYNSQPYLQIVDLKEKLNAKAKTITRHIQ